MAAIGAIILLILVIFIRLKMPEWKGRFSESLVSNKMEKLPDEYCIFNDLLFESNGRSTQIDHVVVSPYGVFVIETKGYKGWIMGGENSEYWTQVIYKGKHQFYNPIKQNDGHVRFLRYLLNDAPFQIKFISIVVFNNNASLKVFVDNHIVINRCDLNSTILQYDERVMTGDNVAWVVNRLKEYHREHTKEEIKAHKENTKWQQYKSSTMVSNGICPKCGGQLVLRHGRYGNFYGCSNYPKCKFTQNQI